jgi:hypothetical protein
MGGGLGALTHYRSDAAIRRASDKAVDRWP